MVAAGETIIAGKVPGERIATDSGSADSSNFTNAAEVVVQSVTAPVVIGRTYRVVFHGSFASSIAADTLFVRIREDSLTGTQLQSTAFEITTTTAVGWKLTLEAEYTADATEDKIFTLTAIRAGGSGNCRLEAGSDHPAYLYVDYIRG
jgi:hypothetical protein